MELTYALTAALVSCVMSPRVAAALTLSIDGATEYVITVSADAIAPEQTAARELQEHLQKATGAQFPIQDELDVAPDAKQIVVGPGPRFRAAFPDLDLAALKHDGIVMKTVGDLLYLAGGRPRGTLYAVYTFLEDVVGCRWWSSKESFIPDVPALEVPDLDTVYVPKLQYREAFYRDAFDGVFAARSRCNGHFERIPPEYGGHYTLLGWCHTFYQLLPPDKYFANHPEWYSLINGRRVTDGAQLCLTNDEMRAELTRNALEWIRRQPDAGMISISQNDWHGPCECDNCRAVQEREGAHSGLLIEFVNKVAADIEREYPDFLVETLAYTYTRKPPLHVRPRHNVVVRLCTIECSFSQPLATGAQNEAFRRDMQGWSAIAPQLYIWDYVTDFANYILPHPNYRVLGPNIRFFVDNKAIGLFEQGDAECSCSCFPELRAWVLSHLMWDPARDEYALVREFMRGYYGPAAEPLLQYLDLICNAVESFARGPVYLSCFIGDTRSWFPLEDINRATELFSLAADLVKDDPVLSARVRRARLPLDHVWLMRYKTLRSEANRAGKPFLGPADPLAAVEDFITTARSFDVGSYREGAPFSLYEPALRGRFRPPAPPPEACKDLPPEDWVDVQDNDFRLYVPGVWVTTVQDPLASDGYAARMPANHREWATQYPVSDDMVALGRAHCYVVVRCDVKAPEGDAFDLGIYDTNTRTNIAAQRESIANCLGGEYRTYDLGVHELKPGMYFWVAPLANPEQVEAVAVDRIYCVRER